MNAAGRDEAIQNIVAYWIGQDGDEIGQLIQDVDFNKLSEQIDDLRKLGRSVRWERGINKWLDCSIAAEDLFRSQNGFPSDAIVGSQNGYTFETGRELIRLFKWAIMQGAIYAGIGNH